MSVTTNDCPYCGHNIFDCDCAWKREQFENWPQRAQMKQIGFVFIRQKGIMVEESENHIIVTPGLAKVFLYDSYKAAPYNSNSLTYMLDAPLVFPKKNGVVLYVMVDRTSLAVKIVNKIDPGLLARGVDYVVFYKGDKE